MRSSVICRTSEDRQNHHERPNRLFTDLIREIMRTKKRFFSLLIMNLLAVGFLAGLRMTAPDMQNTVDEYYDEQQLMDVRIVSTLGLTREDLEAVGALEEVEAAEPSYAFEGRVGEATANVFSVPDRINRLLLMEGRMPENDRECVTEQKMLEALGASVGDEITVDTSDAYKRFVGDDPLREHTFTIVGMVRSPQYITVARSSSQNGSGQVTGFVAVPQGAFDQAYYTSIYLRLKGLSKYNCYTDDAYMDSVDSFIDRIEPLGKERAAERKKQLMHEVTLTDMVSQMIAGDLSALTMSDGKWYILSREMDQYYVEFSSDAERMSNLADVFPLVFFLVAALSSLTSMTRMVEEHRSEIGLMKALGFSDMAVSLKYMGYAAGASVTGGLIGLAVGCTALPSLIYYEWGILYILPGLKLGLSPVVTLYSMGAALLATSGAALAGCYSSLRAAPAALLRPRAPKAGRRVFLEKVSFVWSRLSFIQKVSVRNLFRYQKRFWMTIAGIAGCTALLVTGFGLRDSIFDVLRWQFDRLTVYDATVGIKEDLVGADRERLMQYFDDAPGIEEYASCFEDTISLRTGEGTLENVALTAAADWDALKDLIHIYPRGGGVVRYGKGEAAERERLTPGSDSVIIDEKMAEMMKVDAGDTIWLRDVQEKEYPVVVGDVCENYVNHRVFLTSAYYKTVFGEKPSDNTVLLLLADADGAPDTADTVTAEEILSQDGVLTYSRIDEIRTRFEDSMESLNVVVLIIILAAAILAFLVLFNLTNINVTERIRELATLKVLGFYDNETAAYVYRENMLLTVIGAMAGMVMGKWLHRWLIDTIEVEYLIFGRSVHGRSFAYALLLTAVFSLSVNVFSNYTIRRIDMVESLKSVE